MNLLLLKVDAGRHERMRDLCARLYSTAELIGPASLVDARNMLCKGTKVQMALAFVNELEDCQVEALKAFRWRFPALPVASMHVGPLRCPRRSAPTDRGVLTAREHEVLDSIRRGVSNKGIAGELGVTEGTVKVHCISIYRKLGVSNRTQAAMVGASAQAPYGVSIDQTV